MDAEDGFTRLSEATVAIVGLGLMGGSLAAALSEKLACRRIIGVARREETCEAALARGWFHATTTDLAAGISEADVVVLATPPRVILEQIPLVGAAAPAGCLLLDLGSTKGSVVAAMQALPQHIHPVGGHPMCGREVGGIAAADPSLYEGRPFILTPLERTPPAALEAAQALVKVVGAQPVVLDAEAHDRMVAWVSHLPHLVAVALVRSAMAGAQDDPQVWSLAAAGFRDTTRLAASDLTMMLDIFATNRDALLGAAQQFRTQMSELCDLLEAGDEASLRRLLDEAITKRREVVL